MRVYFSIAVRELKISVCAARPEPGDCCKVAVIFLALYALRCVKFCSNDCLSVENERLFFGRLDMQWLNYDS